MVNRSQPLLWRVLVAAQLAALVLLGAATVARLHVWSPIDEQAHDAYVQTIAEHGRLPSVGDPTPGGPPGMGTVPDGDRATLAATGIAFRNYEAFQPPLYYVLAVPAYSLASGRHDGVDSLRAFDLVLLLAAAALLALLARSTLPAAPLVALSGGLTVLLWPGVLVRGVAVSNLALELVVATALLLALVRGWLLRAGLLLGACLLTKLTLVYMAVPFAIVVLARLREQRRRALAATVLAALVVAPWVVSNLVRFGTLTQNDAARAQQGPVMNPGGYQYRLVDVWRGVGRLGDGVLPQDWPLQLHIGWIYATDLVLLAALLGGALSFAWRRPPAVLLLAGSATVGALGVAAAVMLVSNWDMFLLRYFYAALPALAVGVTAAAYRRVGPRAAGAALVLQFAAVCVLWLHLAGAFYFTDLGSRLGVG